jgi:SAP domain-containing ribonucleoprotein
MDEEELKKLKVPELKALLSERSLPLSGRKEELVQRLLDSQREPSNGDEFISVSTTGAEPAAAKTTRDGAANFAASATRATTQDPMPARQARFGPVAPAASVSASSASLGSSAPPASLDPAESAAKLHSKITPTDDGLLISGGGTQSLEVGAEDIERMRARQTRFGTTAPVLAHLEALERHRGRQQRFQQPSSMEEK